MMKHAPPRHSLRRTAGTGHNITHATAPTHSLRRTAGTGHNIRRQSTISHLDRVFDLHTQYMYVIQSIKSNQLHTTRARERALLPLNTWRGEG